MTRTFYYNYIYPQLNRQLGKLMDLIMGVECWRDVENGTPYSHGPCRVLNWYALFKQVVKIRDITQLRFVDVGCGKGRACFLAEWFGFPRIYGFDKDWEIVLKAESNLGGGSLNRKNIIFHTRDANQFSLPFIPSLLYVFNPFGKEVLRQFFENNHTVLYQGNALIAYENDAERATLSDLGYTLLWRDEWKKCSLWEAR